jgi:hypothetical protein
MATSGKEQREATTAASAAKDIHDEKKVWALFHLWKEALASRDPKQVTARDSISSAILLFQRTNLHDCVLWKRFAEKTQGKIIESVINIGKGLCEDCCVYQLIMGATSEKVMIRYSFVYVLEDGEWTIAHHHLTPMPEPMLKQKEEQDRERALFFRTESWQVVWPVECSVGHHGCQK